MKAVAFGTASACVALAVLAASQVLLPEETSASRPGHTAQAGQAQAGSGEIAPGGGSDAWLAEGRRHVGSRSSDAPGSMSGNADSDPVITRERSELAAVHWALNAGLSEEELTKWLEDVPLDTLARYFEQQTHITRDWLHKKGLDEAEALPRLAQIWGSRTPTPSTTDIPDDTIAFSTRSRNGGNIGTRVDQLFETDRYIYLNYEVPGDYPQDAVIVRWVDMDSGSIAHLDRHRLSATPAETQEAWYRPAGHWAVGRYRVEIFGVDPQLTPIAATTFEIDSLTSGD